MRIRGPLAYGVQKSLQCTGCTQKRFSVGQSANLDQGSAKARPSPDIFGAFADRPLPEFNAPLFGHTAPHHSKINDGIASCALRLISVCRKFIYAKHAFPLLLRHVFWKRGTEPVVPARFGYELVNDGLKMRVQSSQRPALIDCDVVGLHVDVVPAQFPRVCSGAIESFVDALYSRQTVFERQSWL
jgi:hypothetical protein